MEKPNRKQNRLTEFDYGQEGAYFVTLCTQNRARLFQMELPVGNGLCAVPDGVGGGNGTTHRSCPTVPFHFLCRGVQHIFDKDAVAGGRVVDEDMGHRADQFAVLNDKQRKRYIAACAV